MIFKLRDDLYNHTILLLELEVAALSSIFFQIS